MRLTRKEIYFIIFFLAFALRLLYLNQIMESPFFDNPAVNEYEYDSWAREIVSGKLLRDVIPYHGPVYPYILAFIYKIFGINRFMGRLFGVVVSSLTSVLMASFCMRSAGRKAGMIAGVLSAVYWPFIYWSGELLVTTLALFCNMVILLFLWDIKKRPRPFTFLLCGILIGLSAVTRPNILLLMPFIAGWVFFCPMPRRLKLTGTALMISAAAVIIAPVTLMNHIISGDLVFIQAQSGLNMYLGLNPHLDGLHSIRPGIEWDKLMLVPIRLGYIFDSQRTKFWLEQAVLVVSNEPVLFMKHLLRKIFFILSQNEISSGRYIFFNREFAPFIYSLPGFWLIGPLGIGGFLFLLKRVREMDVQYIFISGIFLTSLPFQTCSRYRVTLVAMLLIFASYVVSEFIDRLYKRDKKAVFTMAGLIFIGSLVVNLDIMDTRGRDHSRIHLNLAQAYTRVSQYDKALDEVKKAVDAGPQDADVYKTMGDVFLGMGDLEKAENSYKKALDIEPEYFIVMNDLGVIKGEQGDLDSAERFFRKAVIVYPFFEKAKKNLETCAGLRLKRR